MFKRILAGMLACTLLTAVLAAAAADGVFSVTIAGCSVQDRGTVETGTMVHFTLSAPGADRIQLMIVPPDSTRIGADGAEIDWTLDVPGTWAFVAYAQNPEGEVVHSSQYRIQVSGGAAEEAEGEEAGEEKDEEWLKLEQQFRSWAEDAWIEYIVAEKYKQDYYMLADQKSGFDHTFVNDQKTGSTNAEKNQNYEKETKVYYLYTASQVLMNKERELEALSPASLEAYFPGARYDLDSGTWVVDPYATLSQRQNDEKVAHELNERNIKLADSFAKLFLDDLFLIFERSESREYSIKNRLVEMVSKAELDFESRMYQNTQAQLANDLRDLMKDDLCQVYENLNDVVFGVLKERMEDLQKKRKVQRTQDEQLYLEALEEIVRFKLTADEIALLVDGDTVSRTGTVTASVHRLSSGNQDLKSELEAIAGQAITEFGFDEQMVLTKNEMVIYRLLLYAREAFKALIKIELLDLAKAGDKLGENLTKKMKTGFLSMLQGHPVITAAAGTVSEMSLETLIDLAVNFIWDSTFLDEYEIKTMAEQEDFSWDHCIEFFSKRLEGGELDIFNPLMKLVLNWKDKKIDMTAKVDEFAAGMDQFLNSSAVKNGIIPKERAKDIVYDGLQNSLTNAEKGYMYRYIEKMKTSKWYQAYVENVRENAGFLGAFLSDTVKFVLVFLETLPTAQGLSEFGDTFDEDPIYAVYANGLFRARDMAETERKALNLPSDPSQFFYTGDLKEIRKAIRQMYTIIDCHLVGESLYITLDAAYWAERDPEHIAAVVREYQEATETLKQRNWFLGKIYEPIISLAGLMDAYQKSEFLKYVEEVLGWKKLGDCDEVLSRLQEGMNALSVPPQFEPLFAD